MPEEKSVLLQHLILSHHGEPEFGAAVRPLCAEAELLSLIDAVDSRMEIYRETYDTMEPDTFSPRIFALEKRCSGTRRLLTNGGAESTLSSVPAGHNTHFIKETRLKLNTLTLERVA